MSKEGEIQNIFLVLEIRNSCLHTKKMRINSERKLRRCKKPLRPNMIYVCKIRGIKQWILRFGDKNLGEFLLPRFKVLLHINSNAAVIKSFCVILSPGEAKKGQKKSHFKLPLQSNTKRASSLLCMYQVSQQVWDSILAKNLIFFFISLQFDDFFFWQKDLKILIPQILISFWNV